MFFVCWDNFGNHNPEQVLIISNIFKENTVSVVEFRCSFVFYINFTSLLNSVGGVGSVGAWVREWLKSNFGIDPVGRVGPQF